MRNLGWGHRMKMEVGPFALEGGEKLLEPFHSQLGMVPTLHENLRTTKCNNLFYFLLEFVIRKGVRVVFMSIASKCAKRTFRSTYIRVINVTVDDIRSQVIAMQGSASCISPSTKFRKRHFVVQAFRLFWSYSKISMCDILQHCCVKNIGIWV